MAVIAVSTLEIALGVVVASYAWQMGEEAMLPAAGACILLAGISLGIITRRGNDTRPDPSRGRRSAVRRRPVAGHRRRPAAGHRPGEIALTGEKS